MPLLRYFIFVGGSLLALLLVVNATLPAEPLQETPTSGSDLPPVRIHSDRKLPDRVVFDTSAVLPGQTQAATVVVAQAKPQPQVAIQVQAPVPPAMAEMSAKARVREAFAQLPQEDDASQPTMTDMATVVVPEPKMYPASTGEAQARRKSSQHPSDGGCAAAAFRRILYLVNPG
jgi:hypothetical protein